MKASKTIWNKDSIIRELLDAIEDHREAIKQARRLGLDTDESANLRLWSNLK
jgi:hypothetical protein